MSEPREKDRWRELADLLGLPPDEQAPPPARQERAQAEATPSEPEVPEAEPVADDALEPVRFEELIVTETEYEVERLQMSVQPDPAGSEASAADDLTEDRPRRSRRRGRRGQ